MKKLNIIFQELLKIFFIFLLLFIWFRYLFKSLTISVIVSVLTTTVIYIILALIMRKKHGKIGLKIKEKTDAENMFLSLSCNDAPIDFFEKLASKKHKNITKHKDYILINHVEDDIRVILYPDFSHAGLDIPRFMEIYNKIKKEKPNKIVICCKMISDKQLTSFCLNFEEKFVILDEYETYQKLYKYYNYFPKQTHTYKVDKSMVLKDFIAFSFNKKRTKGYLFSAFVLILSGLFIKMTIYYCVVASLLVVFALISQFNPYFNNKKEVEVI